MFKMSSAAQQGSTKARPHRTSPAYASTFDEDRRELTSVMVLPADEVTLRLSGGGRDAVCSRRLDETSGSTEKEINRGEARGISQQWERLAVSLVYPNSHPKLGCEKPLRQCVLRLSLLLSVGVTWRRYALYRVPFSFRFCTKLYRLSLCLQCFDTVGWAAGRASGL